MKLSEINKKIQIDLSDSERAMGSFYITDQDKEKYFPTKIEDDIGLREIVEINEKDTANIIIYNGLTGAFLDVLTRKGNIFNAFKAFERDLGNFKAFIKYVYLVNPCTQVYVCGIPNILGIGLFRKINKKAKKECFNYPNVTYVDSVKTKFIYSKEGKKYIDIHYDDEEYIKMNINVFKSISDNYIKNNLFIEFDNIIRKYAENIETNCDDYAVVLHELTSKYRNILSYRSNNDLIKIYNELIKFYKSRYPFDYYYTPKEIIIGYLKLRKDLLNVEKLIT